MMPETRLLINCLTWKWPLLFVLSLTCLVSSQTTTIDPDGFEPPPHAISTEALTSHSITLSWQIEKHHAKEVFVTGISIYYSSNPESEFKEIKLAGNATSKFIGNLQSDTKYTMYITAHYSNNKNVSSENFTMSTLDDMSSYLRKDCSCDKQGSLSCQKGTTNGPKCICRPGYDGEECDVCANNFYRQDEQCKPCSCPPATSTGICHLGSEDLDQIVCVCKKGYTGLKCDDCAFGFYSMGNVCNPCSELYKSCLHCPKYDENMNEYRTAYKICRLNATIHNDTQRPVNREDGTVAIIAVVTCLAFIGCVAAFIMCYRRRMQSQNQPPFWSIELAEDKVSLNAATIDYRRLDGKSKSSHHRSSSVAEATVIQRTADQPQYNCISI